MKAGLLILCGLMPVTLAWGQQPPAAQQRFFPAASACEEALMKERQTLNAGMVACIEALVKARVAYRDTLKTLAEKNPALNAQRAEQEAVIRNYRDLETWRRNVRGPMTPEEREAEARKWFEEAQSATRSGSRNRPGHPSSREDASSR